MELRIALIAAGAALAGSLIPQLIGLWQAGRTRRWDREDRGREERSAVYVEALAAIDLAASAATAALVNRGHPPSRQAPSKEMILPMLRAVGRVDLLAPPPVRERCEAWSRHTTALVNFCSLDRPVEELFAFVKGVGGDHTDDPLRDNDERREAFLQAARSDVLVKP